MFNESYPIMNKISKEELLTIDAYRKSYGMTLKKVKLDNMAPIETVLEEWARSKDYFLNKLFGDKLILEQSIEVQKPTSLLGDDLFEAIQANSKAKNFYNKYIELITNLSLCSEFLLLNSTINPYLLINNVLEKNITVFCSNELNKKYGLSKNLVFYKGMKLTKVLKIMAETFNIPNYEDFRLVHSQILNKKMLSGKLCLSIHPLDFMTMSDNDNNWSSCMSWKNGGCYRQGSVEMMNAPYVIIAYLKSKNDMNLYYGEWNSKKWRCLYFVHPRFISSIKAYPFQSDELNHICLHWIKSLMRKAYPEYIYEDDFSFKNTCGEEINTYEEGYQTAIETKHGWFVPITDFMYNDFGTTEHTGFAAITDSESDEEHIINYSGNCQCMCCGAIGYEGLTEDSLICDGCDGRIYCYNCGEEIDTDCDDYYTEIDGQMLCSHCIDIGAFIDDITGETHLIESKKPILIVDDNNLLYKLNIYQYSDFAREIMYNTKIFVYNSNSHWWGLDLIDVLKTDQMTDHMWEQILKISQCNTKKEWIKKHSNIFSYSIEKATNNSPDYDELHISLHHNTREVFDSFTPFERYVV